MKSFFSRGITSGARRLKVLRAPSWALALMAGCVLVPSSASAQEVSHDRVLILYSLGPNFAPWDQFASELKDELKQLSPKPLEFFEASLETARFAETNTEAPLSEYLSALFAESGIDLVVSIGGPAARFCVRRAARVFSPRRRYSSPASTIAPWPRRRRWTTGPPLGSIPTLRATSTTFSNCFPIRPTS